MPEARNLRSPGFTLPDNPFSRTDCRLTFFDAVYGLPSGGAMIGRRKADLGRQLDPQIRLPVDVKLAF
jgi:hypothetical protein